MIALLSSSANRIERRVGPRPFGRGWAPPWRAVAPDLQNFRAEFAVADAGADFHLWPDDCGRTDDFAALIQRNAVSAAQCRVRPEHAQNSLDALEPVYGVFEQVAGAGNQPPMQIRKTVAAYR